MLQYGVLKLNKPIARVKQPLPLNIFAHIEYVEYDGATTIVPRLF